jgi:hypothetical protein
VALLDRIQAIGDRDLVTERPVSSFELVASLAAKSSLHLEDPGIIEETLLARVGCESSVDRRSTVPDRTGEPLS